MNDGKTEEKKKLSLAMQVFQLSSHLKHLMADEHSFFTLTYNFVNGVFTNWLQLNSLFNLLSRRTITGTIRSLRDSRVVNEMEHAELFRSRIEIA